MTRALFLLGGMALPIFGQANFSLCDINHDHVVNVADAQAMANQALGTQSAANDLTGDGKVNLVDLQLEIDNILFGCSLYSPVPRFAITAVTLLNQAWVSADIPSPGNVAVTAAVARQASVMNQAWIAADIPSAGNLAVNAAIARPASVVNQAWIPADIPSAGNTAVTAASARPVSVVNQAWISADIPSPGDIRFAAGLLVSVNNNGTPGTPAMISAAGAKVIGGGSSTTPVDFASLKSGDAMLAGQTIRVRVYPPEEAATGSDFLVNGTTMRLHASFEIMLTAPAGVSSLDLEAVLYSDSGRVWRTPSTRLLVLPDPGVAWGGRAVLTNRQPAASVPIGVRVNGLTSEFYPAGKSAQLWPDVHQLPAKRGFVTAVNQVETTAFGSDPFGAALPGDFTLRLRGEVLVTTAGDHRFFVNSPLGSRLSIDGRVLVDSPPAQFSPELQASTELQPGWHSIEIDSYQSAGSPGLQLSWQQPNTGREIVPPEALSAETGQLAMADSNGEFHIASFPGILNPLEWHAIPASNPIQIELRPDRP